ncbi:PrgI family mobile element protein [Paenibacillus sp. Y412MC10]|uniref:PrgI family mobile element protein n=1 Tax=Geobacillus sp. (strain Y412MC10) TaxID=481743 RepID=UPI0011AB4083|nr:PrgI family protein [Paenibacillus sp. Y412MC10]
MNEIVVPIDITQEEKSVLAVFSLRQFFLVVPVGFAMIAFIMWGTIPFMSGFGNFLVRVILFVIVEGVAIALAYFKMDKYEMYLSDYLKVLWKFHRSQKVYQSL